MRKRVTLSPVFWQLSRSFEWTNDQLSCCSLNELEILARMLGIAFSGSKQRRIERLMTTLAVRRELATWCDMQDIQHHIVLDLQIKDLCARYSRARLVSLCKAVDLPAYLNKYALVTALLNWRNTCRERGADFTRHFQAEIQRVKHQRPKQLLFDPTLRGASNSLTHTLTLSPRQQQKSLASRSPESVQLSLTISLINRDER